MLSNDSARCNGGASLLVPLATCCYLLLLPPSTSSCDSKESNYIHTYIQPRAFDPSHRNIHLQTLMREAFEHQLAVSYELSDMSVYCKEVRMQLLEHTLSEIVEAAWIVDVVSNVDLLHPLGQCTCGSDFPGNFSTHVRALGELNGRRANSFWTHSHWGWTNGVGGVHSAIWTTITLLHDTDARIAKTLPSLCPFSRHTDIFACIHGFGHGALQRSMFASTPLTFNARTRIVFNSWEITASQRKQAEELCLRLPTNSHRLTCGGGVYHAFSEFSVRRSIATELEWCQRARIPSPCFARSLSLSPSCKRLQPTLNVFIFIGCVHGTAAKLFQQHDGYGVRTSRGFQFVQAGRVDRWADRSKGTLLEFCSKFADIPQENDIDDTVWMACIAGATTHLGLARFVDALSVPRSQVEDFCSQLLVDSLHNASIRVNAYRLCVASCLSDSRIEHYDNYYVPGAWTTEPRED